MRRVQLPCGIVDMININDIPITSDISVDVYKLVHNHVFIDTSLIDANSGRRNMEDFKISITKISASTCVLSRNISEKRRSFDHEVDFSTLAYICKRTITDLLACSNTT